MSLTILLSCALALAFGALQLRLMRGVFLARTGLLRALLLGVKLPLWGLAFFGVLRLLGETALMVFGLTAGAVYLVASLWMYFRSQKGE